MQEIFDLVKKMLNISDINLLNEIFKNEGDVVYKTASLAKGIIKLASLGNDVALAIIQEATTNVAEYIIYLIDEIEYEKNNIMISAHGSIIKNKLF